MQPERPTMRLRGYDYARAGFYFVTLCTHERAPLFGRLCDGEMYSNDVGEIVRCCWRTIPAHHNRVFLDEFVLMPDHVHGVLGLGIDGNPLDGRDGDGDGRARHASPLLGTVVGSFKAAAARLINLHRGTPGATVWQRGYHEHIVKNEGDLRRIREYIAMNPSMSRM